MFSISATVSAQDSEDASNYHPFLSDTIMLNLGVFNARNSTSVGLGIDGEDKESVNSSRTDGSASLAVRWRYTENWSLWAQAWAASDTATATLEEDISFGEGSEEKTIFAGSNINLTTELDILRLFFGRSFFKKPQSEWGAGLGLHWMELGATLTTKFITEPDHPDASGTNSASVKTGVPLPNLGIWYMYSWSPKWVTMVRADWLEVDLGEYSGNMYDVSAGVNWQFSRHVGVGLAYQFFDFGAAVNGTGGNTEIEIKQNGPFLSLSANW
ncbi:MAG: hypothetical protein DRR42_23975 [Gammaproteobacteria bacterium]|nr:MAG: hypothetical protein DRR42_23975 [Gammaproteobacteria bacterium]